MYSIKENIKNEFIIQKSRFITYLYKVNDKSECKNILYNLKNSYKDATHYCYAYIINSDMKCSDDGEPSKTAGAPILNVLKHNNLNYILCIVIRYFGGIKLGAGGLVRAYTKSITECLNNADIIELKSGFLIEICFNHSNIKQVDYILKGYIIEKEFGELVTYRFNITKDDYNILINILNSFILKSKIIKNIYF